jgi:hypothetical protein
LFDFNYTWVSGQIFENYTNIEFHENLSNGSRVVPCGRTDIQADVTKLIVAFRSFANAPKNRARTKPKIQNKNEAVQFTDDNNYNYYYYYYYYYYYCCCCCCIFTGIPIPLLLFISCSSPSSMFS